MTTKLQATSRLIATEVKAPNATDQLKRLSPKDKQQITKWMKEQHPYLDDDIKLRDRLYKILEKELGLEDDNEPYLTMVEFLKKNKSLFADSSK